MQTNQTEKNKRRRLEHWQMISIALVFYDFLAVCGAYILALLVRFDFVYSRIPGQYITPYNHFILPYAAGSIAVFMLFRMYNSVWRYASYTELMRTLSGSVCA